MKNNLVDIIETQINDKNAKFLISAFYNKTPSETILKHFNTDLFDSTGIEKEIKDCINMILASDYYSAVCSYNLDLYKVFSILLKIDSNLHIMIPESLNQNPELLRLWSENGKGKNDINERVSFFSKNVDIKDTDYNVIGLQYNNHLSINNCDRVCNLILDVTGKTKENVAEELFEHSPVNNIIHSKINFSNININWFYRHVGIFINI